MRFFQPQRVGRTGLALLLVEVVEPGDKGLLVRSEEIANGHNALPVGGVGSREEGATIFDSQRLCLYLRLTPSSSSSSFKKTYSYYTTNCCWWPAVYMQDHLARMSYRFLLGRCQRLQDERVKQ